MNLNNRAVQNLFEKRWQKHPLCKSIVKDAKSCWKIVLEQELITPLSIAKDPDMTKIYSNYPLSR